MKLLPERISSKIWLIVAAFVLSLTGIIVHSFLVKGELQKQLQEFSENSNLANSEGRILVAKIDAQLKAYQDAVVSGETELIDSAKKDATEAQKSVKKLKQIASPVLVTRISKFETTHNSFTSAAEEIYPLLMSDDMMDESVFEKSAELAQQKVDIRAEAVGITVSVSDELSHQMESLVGDIGKKKIIDLITGTLVIAILVVIVFFMVKLSITHPFADFIHKVKILSDGDLTVRFSDEKKDELSELGRYLNHYVEGLVQSIRSIYSNSEQLKSLATETQESAVEIQQNSDGMAGQAETVHVAGDELSEEIRTISQNAEEMTSSTISVAGAIEEMSAAIAEVAVQCSKQTEIVEEANSKAHVANQLMLELGDAAQEIQKIVEIINAIAAQTNLLALNATIEAASAGEAGKGFAVVANEVKELARQSSDSSGKIATQIQNIHQKTQESLKAVTEISEIMEQVSEYSNTIATSVEEQSSTNQEISGTMQTVTGFTEEVSGTVKKSSESAASVANNIGGVNSSISKFRTLASSTLERSTQLSELSTKLLSAVEIFKTQ